MAFVNQDNVPDFIKQKVEQHKSSTGKFVLFNILDLSTETELPEADLSFQFDNLIYQYVFIPSSEIHKRKVLVKPGAYSFVSTPAGINIEPTEFKPQVLLESVVNTSFISSEMEVFFKKLDVYRNLNLPLARKILVHSAPGCGKTTAIFSYCSSEIKKDPGTVVITWPTSSVRPNDVLSFFDGGVEYSPECSKLIIIMEDIGGGEREGSYSPRDVSGALLEFLDGGKNLFVIPTFVAATTNYPENLVASLADRPGRFDKIIGLDYPKAQERVEIAEFIIKRSLEGEEKKSLMSDKAKSFSIAHIKEIIVRHMLYDITIADAVLELYNHQQNFKNNFEKKKSGGFAFDRDYDD